MITDLQSCTTKVGVPTHMCVGLHPNHPLTWNNQSNVLRRLWKGCNSHQVFKDRLEEHIGVLFCHIYQLKLIRIPELKDKASVTLAYEGRGCFYDSINILQVCLHLSRINTAGMAQSRVHMIAYMMQVTNCTTPRRFHK